MAVNTEQYLDMMSKGRNYFLGTIYPYATMVPGSVYSPAILQNVLSLVL